MASLLAPFGLTGLAYAGAFAAFGAAAAVVGGRRVVARSAENERVTRLLAALWPAPLACARSTTRSRRPPRRCGT